MHSIDQEVTDKTTVHLRQNGQTSLHARTHATFVEFLHINTLELLNIEYTTPFSLYCPNSSVQILSTTCRNLNMTETRLHLIKSTQTDQQNTSRLALKMVLCVIQFMGKKQSTKIVCLNEGQQEKERWGIE